MPTALITGASSGLGEEFAYALARERFDLVLTARRDDRLAAVAARARTAGAANVLTICADLGDREAPKEIYRQATEEGRHIDYLVNNAGFGTTGNFADLPIDRELEEIDLNITSLVAMTRLFLPPMVERRRGTIINVASTAAFQPTPYMATYGSTKAFVLNFSEAVASEVRRTGVTVMALCPGPVHTEFQQVAKIDRMRLPSFVWTDAARVVSEGIAAAAAGRAVCITGGFNAAMVLATKFTPRALTTYITNAVMRPAGTNNK